MKISEQLSRRWQVYLLASLMLLLFVYTIVGARGAVHLWRLRGEKVSLDEQNYRLQKENETLRQRIFRLRTDDRYLEEVARQELNLVRPGEVVYRFPSTEPRKSRTGALNASPRESLPSKAQTSRR
jgi:cell division protein FtsB